MVTTGARGCRLAGSSGDVEHALFDVGLGDAADGMTELLGDELGGVGVDRIGDLRHVTLLHQDADHVDAALGHAIGELLDRDGLRDRHFARDLFLGLVAMTGHALHAPAEGGDRALAHFVGRKRGDHGQSAAALFGAAARRLRRRRRPRRRTTRATAGAARCFFFIGLEYRSSAGRL